MKSTTNEKQMLNVLKDQIALIFWYQENRRNLPWRKNKDPYQIWISEVMLQQTMVAAVIPYYEKFMKRFPTLIDLSKAPQNEVLEYWAGLGYYSRARNLHEAAKYIVKEHGSVFPKTYEPIVFSWFICLLLFCSPVSLSMLYLIIKK